jgi:DNA-binding CsgD family transcriptional regulator
LLTLTGQDLADSSKHKTGEPVPFRVAVEGEQRTLEPLIQDEAYPIARELLRNAFEHASASEIEAEIRYEDHPFRLRIRDDGKGIEPKILNAGGSAGRCGLLGMHERAKRIGGQLTVREIDVLRLIAAGNANKQIAAQLSITEETVKTHVTNILSKLGANDRTHAVTIALKRGIVEL